MSREVHEQCPNMIPKLKCIEKTAGNFRLVNLMNFIKIPCGIIKNLIFPSLKFNRNFLAKIKLRKISNLSRENSNFQRTHLELFFFLFFLIKISLR